MSIEVEVTGASRTITAVERGGAPVAVEVPDAATRTAGVHMGRRGDVGPAGPQGEVGPVGPQGPQGETGATGPQGPVGPEGPQGETGESAYDEWLAQGNVGSEADFLASLVGAQGPQGPEGPQGETGPVGPEGPPGPEGPEGPQGTTDYNDLTNKPTIPSGEMANLARATASQIRALSGDAGITASRIADAAALPNGLDGGFFGVSFDWTAFISDYVILSGNRTLANPTGVIPGTTRAITFMGNSGTTRSLSFGSNYKGDLPTVGVTSTSYVTLFFYAVSANQILVSEKAWS